MFKSGHIGFAGFTTCQDNCCVAGGSVGVDGNTVEGAGDYALKHCLQIGRGDFCVGEDQRDQGGHVRFDHADTFCNTNNASAGTSNFALRNFAYGVGGHDSFCNRIGRCALRLCGKCGKTGTDFVHWVLAANYAG